VQMHENILLVKRGHPITLFSEAQPTNCTNHEYKMRIVALFIINITKELALILFCETQSRINVSN